VQYGGTEGFNAIQHMMHKRRSFEHEHEVRGMLWRPKQYGYNRHFDADNKVHPMPLTPPDTAKGVKCEVNLHTLITGVIVSPAAPSWFHRVLLDLTARLGYAFPVVASDLYRLKYLPSS
jgi:hypothetical protein